VFKAVKTAGNELHSVLDFTEITKLCT